MDADHIFVALSTGNMMKSYDGGVTWTVTPQCFQTSLLDMFFLNENDGFGLIDYGKILKTNNGGDSWTQFHLSTLNPMYAMLYPSAIEFTDELTGYVFAAGDCGKVFKTEDGGDSWYDATPGMEILSLNDGCFPSEETGFAVGAYGTAISTHDSGNTWEPMDVGTEVTVWDISFSSTMVGCGACKTWEQAKVIFTTDGGVSWNEFDFNNYLVQTVGAASDSRFFVGGGDEYNATMFRYELSPASYTITASAGANGNITPSGQVIVYQGDNKTFTITANDNYHIEDVLVDGISVGDVAEYTFENITDNHTISASFAFTTSIPEMLIDCNSYPNPTNDNVTIKAKNMNHITVISPIGQIVYDCDVEGEMTTLHMAQYKTGTYIIRIATENGVSVKRISVVR